MTESIADNSSILAFKSDKDATIIVTEEQILVVRNSSEVYRHHSHSLHAIISKDFVITVDDQRKANIYNVSQVITNEITVARQFQLPQEVHSLSIASPEDSQYLVMNYWNT